MSHLSAQQSTFKLDYQALKTTINVFFCFHISEPILLKKDSRPS